jgi:predicted lipid carrier protein YhbT
VLLAMVHGTLDGDALFFSRDITIEGDTNAVLAMRNAIDAAEIDLPSEIAALFGPLGPVARATARVALPIMGRLFDVASSRWGVHAT